MVPEILSRIRPPTFLDQDFSILNFGAVEGGEIDNTNAFKEAIEACNAAGGGRVVVPSVSFSFSSIFDSHALRFCIPGCLFDERYTTSKQRQFAPSRGVKSSLYPRHKFISDCAQSLGGYGIDELLSFHLCIRG